jgi:hypothetical protein
MQKVPKIVQDRLKAATPLVNHPDADLLTAFSERSLPTLERDVVLEHLARCGECREIVALSVPASEPLQEVFQPSPGGWFAWPALRWGFVAAGVALVASLGIMQYRKHASVSTMAYKEPMAASLKEEAAKQEGARQAVPAPAVVADDKPNGYTAQQPTRGLTDSAASSLGESKSAKRDEPIPAVPLAPGRVPASPARNSLAHGPKGPSQWQQLNANSNQAVLNQAQQNAPESVAKMQAPARSLPSQIQSTTNEADARRVEAVQNAPAVQSLDTVAVARVDKAKPATETVEVSSVQVAPVPSAAGVVGGAIPLASQWTISAAGTLQRSLDEGRTWQNVDVAATSPMKLYGGITSETVEKKSRSKSKDSDIALNKELSAPLFRALAVNGSDVWAGGTGGVLYHTTDSGAHWTRAVPSSSNAVLTGDILTLDFSDPQHGRISTSTSEVWITSDAGQSWQKQ